MRNLLTTTAAVAAIALGAAACSKPAQNNMANAEATSSNTSENTTTAAGAKVSDATAVAQDTAAAAVGAVGGVTGAATPAMFVDNASQSDMLEIESAKVALERAKAPAIKKFAREMIAAHEKTTAELKKIVAADKGGDLKIAPALDNRRQGLVDNLKHASADDFDARYLDQQAADHREASELMKTYAKVGNNDALKAFAAKTAPVVDEHLAMAKDLDKSHGGDKDASKGNATGAQ